MLLVAEAPALQAAEHALRGSTDCRCSTRDGASSSRDGRRSLVERTGDDTAARRDLARRLVGCSGDR